MTRGLCPMTITLARATPFASAASAPVNAAFAALLAVPDSKGGMAHVTTPCVIQSNGVIHVVDRALLPE